MFPSQPPKRSRSGSRLFASLAKSPSSPKFLSAAADAQPESLLLQRAEGKTQLKMLLEEGERRCEQIELWEHQLTETVKSALTADNRIREMKSSRLVKLNVGGTYFDVPVSTLLASEGSYFHHLLDSSNSGFHVDTDSTGAILIDRDPVVFRHILNYLRGYSRGFQALSSDVLAMIHDDAAFYNLKDLQAVLEEVDSNTALLFEGGPGVHVERQRFRCAYLIGIVGEQWLLAGRHSITFQILQAEYIGIGVVSEACVSLDQEFHRTENCCIYYMSGVFYMNFPHHRKEEWLVRYQPGDYVSVELDMDDKTLEFRVNNGASKIVPCTSALGLRFAVAAKLNSSVRIVEEDEMKQHRNNWNTQDVAAATDLYPE